jgi:hypothetical protein
MLLDSTTISLCLTMFPWAGFKRSKGAVKAHTVLDHDDYMPRFMMLTTGKTSDVRAARQISLPPQSIVTCDRAYLDFSTFAKWDAQEVYFVCRSPNSPIFEVIHQQQVRSPHIIQDQLVRYTGRYSGRYPKPLRRITVRTEDNDPLVLITNHMDFAPSTIANIYKERWKIEVFFKTLKQNLKIKTFVGTTAGKVAEKNFRAPFGGTRPGIALFRSQSQRCNPNPKIVAAICRFCSQFPD